MVGLELKFPRHLGLDAKGSGGEGEHDRRFADVVLELGLDRLARERDDACRAEQIERGRVRSLKSQLDRAQAAVVETACEAEVAVRNHNAAAAAIVIVGRLAELRGARDARSDRRCARSPARR